MAIQVTELETLQVIVGMMNFVILTALARINAQELKVVVVQVMAMGVLKETANQENFATLIVLAPINVRK